MGFITGAADALEVQGRRKVSDEKAAAALEEELTKKLTTLKDSGKEPVIADLDLSQNHCPSECFESVFGLLATQCIHVQRLRLFGCPTMTDEAVVPLAEYLKTVPPEAAPFELHLSDCALTTVGFATLMDAIEENPAYPCVNPTTEKKAPLYMRLENNYIEPSAMQEKVDAKIIKIFLKDGNKSIGKLSGEEKVYLLKRHNQVGFSQKEGPPPAPEEVAPVRTQVFDWRFKQNQQQSKGGDQWVWVPENYLPTVPQWGKSQWHQPQWNQGKGKTQEKGSAKSMIKPVQSAVSQPQVVSSPKGGGKQGCKWCEKGECWSHGAGKGAKGKQGIAATGKAARNEDRSRTPAPKGNTGKGGAPAQPLRPPPGMAKKLPHPWQEQFSEEYQIPYFWNPETLESSWETPTA